jgi:hypothetical protein
MYVCMYVHVQGAHSLTYSLITCGCAHVNFLNQSSAFACPSSASRPATTHEYTRHTITHMHTYTHTCILIYTHIHTYMHTHIHTYMHTHILIYSYTHIHTHTYTYTHTHISTHKHTQAHKHTHTHTHTHVTLHSTAHHTHRIESCLVDVQEGLQREGALEHLLYLQHVARVLLHE